MNALRARHRPVFADQANWPRFGALLKSAALATLLGVSMLIASREAADALDALAPPAGSTRSPIEPLVARVTSTAAGPATANLAEADAKRGGR